jgi:hypothetical protein
MGVTIACDIATIDGISSSESGSSSGEERTSIYSSVRSTGGSRDGTPLRFIDEILSASGLM